MSGVGWPPGHDVGNPRVPRARPPSMFGNAGNVSAPRGVDVTVRSATDGRDMLVNTPDGWEVDQPWLWWDGPDGGDGTGGPLGNPPPGARSYGQWSVPAAVTRCTELIAGTIAGMPWQVHRDQGQERLDSPDWITDPQARRLDSRIHSGPVPEWRLSAFEFRSQLLTSMLWTNYGEGMIYVPSRNADGSPAPPIWLLNPDAVSVENGRYYIGDGGDGSNNTGYEFQPGELIVIRGLMRGDIRGIGVLQAHWQDLGLSSALRDFAENMLRRGIPAGYLKVNAPNLTREKAREVQREWMKQHAGPRKKIAVLNATTEFMPLALDPASLELASMRDYSNLDYALMFGVPPYMLGIRTDTNTYANVTSRLIELAEFTHLPWARRVESGLDSEFPRGTALKINLDGLRRADTLTRYQAHQIALASKFLTVDEVREMEDRPPLTDQQRAELALPHDAASQAATVAGPAVPAVPVAAPAPPQNPLQLVRGGQP